ncbi:hypothetical protein BH23ACT12_BH23ACT12_10950 [soil metagenome]
MGTRNPFSVFVAFTVLLLIPVDLSLVGVGRSRDRAARLRTTREVMVFSGVVLMVTLLLVGFIRDFLLASPDVMDTTVALAYPTVLVMLGLGLFFIVFRAVSASGTTTG